MCFAARPRARMTGMARALIRHVKLLRRKGGSEFFANVVHDSHDPASPGGHAKSSNTFSCFLPVEAHNPIMTGKPRPRFKSDIRIKKDRAQAQPEPSAQPCAIPGCGQAGNCRVPKSRENLTEHVFVC